jgi:tetratricopeptide (TPR) repeat protein
MMMRHAAVALVIAASLLLTSVAQAQSVSRSTYKVLQQVQLLQEEERFEEALAELELLLNKTRDDPYDFAVTNQYIAHTSVQLNDNKRARSALEAGLASTELPPDIRADLNLFYGTVLLGEEEYELARAALEDWFAVDEFPSASQIFTLSYANYMSGDLARTEILIARALGTAEKPRDTWYQLYYRVLFEQKKFEAAEIVLLGMISRDPTREQLWRTLASHYMQLERSTDALAAIMIAYNIGLIDGEKDFQQIVSLYNYIDIPEKGARMMQQWIEEDKLPGDAETLKQLGSLWLLARERESAKGVLRQAATLAPDGRTFELLGGIYFEDEDWDQAHRAYRDALGVGGLEEPLRISLLAGISAYRAGRMEDARISLQAAARSDEYRSQAESLLRQLN